MGVSAANPLSPGIVGLGDSGLGKSSRRVNKLSSTSRTEASGLLCSVCLTGRATWSPGTAEAWPQNPPVPSPPASFCTILNPGDIVGWIGLPTLKNGGHCGVVGRPSLRSGGCRLAHPRACPPSSSRTPSQAAPWLLGYLSPGQSQPEAAAGVQLQVRM